MAVYDPPICYMLPEFLAQRVRTQGLSVVETVLTAQIATATTAGDTVTAAFLTTHKTKVHNAPR